MRNRFENWKHIGHYLGNLLIIFGPVMLVPLAVIVLAPGEKISASSALPYVLPSALSVLCGLLLTRLLPSGDLAGGDAALVCVLAGIFRSDTEEFVFPRGNVAVRAGDRVFLAATSDDVQKAADCLGLKR